jgi:hypothetical protein
MHVKYYYGYAYYWGLTRFSYFEFPECLRGWLDYPGHSILFSRPLVASLELTGGLSRHYSCGHPIGISLQVRPWRHLTPDWHFSSRLLVASPEFWDGPVSSEFSFRHPFGISLQDLPWCHLTSDRHFFYFVFLWLSLFITNNFIYFHMLIFYHAMN